MDQRGSVQRLATVEQGCVRVPDQLLRDSVYHKGMGAEPGGINTLEVAYSVGLAAGIIVFFNHIGGRRLTKDPTPVEVSINNYETDVEKTLIEQAGREGREIEGDNGEL